MQNRLGIIGAGAWGTALSVVANRAGSKVMLWSRNEQAAETMREKRVNEVYLPGIFLDPSIEISTNLQEVSKCDMLMLVIPSQSLRTLCISLSDSLEPTIPLVLCTKGVERGSLALMSEVVKSTLPANPVAILSGPNFALEAAQGLPTATTIACEDAVLGERLMDAIGGRAFRPYLSDDIIGVQIGGAVKNVIAIACGIAQGYQLGENARAAIITRGLAEMIRLAVVKGGRAETLTGLSGVGDLTLTCSSTQSRNMSLGIAVAQGKNPREAITNQIRGLAEGIATADSVYDLSIKLGVSMPICEAVHHMLRGKMSVEEGIAELLSRPLGAEGR